MNNILKNSILVALAAFGSQLAVAATSADVSDSGSLLSLRNSGNSEIVADRYNQALSQAAEQNLRVVYFGTEKFKGLMSKSAENSLLDENGTKQIVIVESGNQDKDLIMRLLAKGNFIISIGNAQINAVQSAFDMLEDISYQGKLTKPIAQYDENQARSRMVSGSVDGSKTEELIQEELVSAFYYSPQTPRTFSTTEQNLTLALSQAIKWARDIEFTPQTKGTATYHLRQTSNNCYDTYTAPDQLAGILNISTTYSKVPNTNPNIDWWTVTYVSQLVPRGPVDNVTYLNQDLWNSVDVNAKNPAYNLINYGPTTTPTDANFSYGLSVGDNGVSYSATKSYTLRDVTVYDSGNIGADTVSWQHAINASSNSGKYTIKMEPGMLISVPEGAYPWLGLPEYYKAQWRVQYQRAKRFVQCTYTYN